MSNHSAKLVAVIFASLLGANFAAVAQNVAKPADSCLSGPKGAVPAGSHWYFHTDRDTKRHCWYLGEEKDKTAAAAPQDAAASTAAAPAAAATPPAAADPVPPQANASVRKSIADAHAELPSPQARADQDPAVNVPPGNSAAAAVPAIQDNQSAVAPDAGAPPSIVTSRWPDSSGASSPNNSQPAAADPPASAPVNASPAPQPTASPVALAAADSTLQKQSGSTQMLLMVMAGALALAGITASLVFRFARARVQPEIWSDRRAIWDSVDTGRSSPSRSSPSLFPDENVPRWRDNVARDPRAPDDPERRVQEMLARLARSAQT